LIQELSIFANAYRTALADQKSRVQDFNRATLPALRSSALRLLFLQLFIEIPLDTGSSFHPHLDLPSFGKAPVDKLLASHSSQK